MELTALIGIAGAVILCFFLYVCIKTGGFTCQACGEKVYLNRTNRNRVRFGRLPCPKCGTLIEVDH